MCFPCALARLLPSAVRVRIRSRSKSAIVFVGQGDLRPRDFRRATGKNPLSHTVSNIQHSSV
jgi:hypothetical protein